MPSRKKRNRKALEEDGGLEADASPDDPLPAAGNRRKRARTNVEPVDEPVETNGNSSTTLVGESPAGQNKASTSKREKGKGKAVSPPPPSAGFREEITQGRCALLSKLARSFSCGICISLYDNPQALACGHIFCRACLEKSFRREVGVDETDSRGVTVDSDSGAIRDGDSVSGPTSPGGPIHLSAEERRRNLVCPVCRARVTEPPMPIFAFREAADVMRGAEVDGLLPADNEREADSPASSPNRAFNAVKRAKQDADLTWRGLFPLQDKTHRKKRRDIMSRGLNDRDDGVYRCYECNWEIEDGTCNGCGRVFAIESRSNTDLEMETDEESHFSNLPNDREASGGNSAQSSSSDDDDAVRLHLDRRRRIQHRQSERVDLDTPGSDDAVDDDSENSDDRDFIAPSDDDEEDSRGLRSRSRSHGDESPNEVGSRSSEDEAPSPRRRRKIVQISSSENESDEAASDAINIDPAANFVGEGSTSNTGSGTASDDARDDDVEESNEGSSGSEETTPARVRAGRAAAARQRASKRRPNDNEDEGESSADDAPDLALPVRRRRIIIEASPPAPRRRTRRIQESDDDDADEN